MLARTGSHSETMRHLPTNLLTMQYHDTYWYAQAVFRTLTDETPDYLRTLNEFFGDENYTRLIRPFPKWSILHDYILFVVLQVEFEQLPEKAGEDFLKWHNDGSLKVYATSIEYQLELRGIEHIDFSDWARANNIELMDADMDHFSDYQNELGSLDVTDGARIVEGPRGTLYEQLTDEVFFWPL